MRVIKESKITSAGTFSAWKADEAERVLGQPIKAQKICLSFDLMTIIFNRQKNKLKESFNRDLANAIT